VSFDAAAEAIGAAIGKRVAHVEVTPGQALEGLTAMGVSKSLAESYIEMYDRFRKGAVAPEGTPRRGETTFKAFAGKAFRVGYEAMTQQG